jgi:hypothetical protein
MCTRHPDFERVRALATAIVGPATKVSIDSPSFDAWMVNAVIGPLKEKAGGRYAVGLLPANSRPGDGSRRIVSNPDLVWLMRA